MTTRRTWIAVGLTLIGFASVAFAAVERPLEFLEIGEKYAITTAAEWGNQAAASMPRISQVRIIRKFNGSWVQVEAMVGANAQKLWLNFEQILTVKEIQP